MKQFYTETTVKYSTFKAIQVLNEDDSGEKDCKKKFKKIIIIKKNRSRVDQFLFRSYENTVKIK